MLIGCFSSPVFGGPLPFLRGENPSCRVHRWVHASLASTLVLPLFSIFEYQVHDGGLFSSFTSSFALSQDRSHPLTTRNPSRVGASEVRTSALFLPLSFYSTLALTPSTLLPSFLHLPLRALFWVIHTRSVAHVQQSFDHLHLPSPHLPSFSSLPNSYLFCLSLL